MHRKGKIHHIIGRRGEWEEQGKDREGREQRELILIFLNVKSNS